MSEKTEKKNAVKKKYLYDYNEKIIDQLVKEYLNPAYDKVKKAFKKNNG